MLTFLFNFFFPLNLFFYYGLKVRVRVTSQSYFHTSVTSDDTVTVIVTSHKVTRKDIKGFRKITLYSM